MRKYEELKGWLGLGWWQEIPQKMIVEWRENIEEVKMECEVGTMNEARVQT